MMQWLLIFNLLYYTVDYVFRTPQMVCLSVYTRQSQSACSV